MELDNLYELAERENIDICNYKMNFHKARIMNDNKSRMIFMDYKKINTYKEEKELLAEELGHYYHSAYYSICSPKIIIEKAEYRANKWKALALVTKSQILDCYKKGLYTIPEIVEELQVDPSTLEFAYNYYFPTGA